VVQPHCDEHHKQHQVPHPVTDIDWDTEAKLWAEDTNDWADEVRDYVSTLWAEDWDSTEDSTYDDTEENQ
jgi:hypothetical protein